MTNKRIRTTRRWLKLFIFSAHVTIFSSLPTVCIFSQHAALDSLIHDPALANASVSFTLINTETGDVLYEYESHQVLIPASTQKLITSAVAIELLGVDHTFKTSLYHSGSIDKKSGVLNGDIIISGGGDPTLGSRRFAKHYGNIIEKWATAIKSIGIKSINGRIITDDSYYDYLPVPSAWLFEDIGNYYGAGVYGLSIFDNTFELHLKSGEENSTPIVLNYSPSAYNPNLTNRLTSSGTRDEGYIFATPYSTSGWISGTIPINKDNFTLKGAISDPPLLTAQMLTNALKSDGIGVSKSPSTQRLESMVLTDSLQFINTITSPSLIEIAKVLNHESVNLYAETFLKEISKENENTGSTSQGIDIIEGFMELIGINPDEVRLRDGSGLSPMNAISSYAIATLLSHMTTSENYGLFLSTLASPGSEGTIKDIFTDPVFHNTLKVKSGSMTGVRSYAGYLTIEDESVLSFCIIVNNFTGSSAHVIKLIETVIKNSILANIF